MSFNIKKFFNIIIIINIINIILKLSLIIIKIFKVIYLK
jgi:hypothetical protein